MTPADYLAFERASDRKHEYVDGEVFAMAGGTRAHNLIAANAVGELHAALLDRPCEVYGSDMKVEAERGQKYHYPDALVLCGAPVLSDAEGDAVQNPKVIVEVLSDTTERYDRGDKFASYATIPSFSDYVLASQHRVRVEHFQRQADGSWIFRALGPGETLVLASIGCEIAVDRLYLKVFPAKG